MTKSQTILAAATLVASMSASAAVHNLFIGDSELHAYTIQCTDSGKLLASVAEAKNITIYDVDGRTTKISYLGPSDSFNLLFILVGQNTTCSVTK